MYGKTKRTEVVNVDISKLTPPGNGLYALSVPQTYGLRRGQQHLGFTPSSPPGLYADLENHASKVQVILKLSFGFNFKAKFSIKFVEN